MGYNLRSRRNCGNLGNIVMLILVSDELFIRNFSAISAISAGQKIKDLSERLKQECRTRSWRCLLLDEREFS